MVDDRVYDSIDLQTQALDSDSLYNLLDRMARSPMFYTEIIATSSN